jgi:hypothetical protein
LPSALNFELFFIGARSQLNADSSVLSLDVLLDKDFSFFLLDKKVILSYDYSLLLIPAETRKLVYPIAVFGIMLV